MTALLVCCQSLHSSRRDGGSTRRPKHDRGCPHHQDCAPYMNGSVHSLPMGNPDPSGQPPLCRVSNYTLVNNISSFSSSSPLPTPAWRTLYRPTTIAFTYHFPSTVTPADDEWRGLAQDVWEHAGYAANAVRRTWLCPPWHKGRRTQARTPGCLLRACYLDGVLAASAGKCVSSHTRMRHRAGGSKR